MSYNLETGYLKVILGSMFAGKTSELIKEYNKHISCDFKCCIINHTIDNRYGTDETTMATHNNKIVECKSCYKLSDIFGEEFDNGIINDYDVFLINEGQFFEDLYDCVDSIVNKKKKKVYVCGLDGDYKRKKFGSILDIIPLCDDIVKLKGICRECCIKEAIFTHRITKEKEQTVISSEVYNSLCRKCYNKSNKVFIKSI
jgi:thymidine kinase